MINIRDEDYLKVFGSHLRKLREARHLSQEKLAIMADISENQIYNIENGKNNVTLCTLRTIAKALELSLPKLVDFES